MTVYQDIRGESPRPSAIAALLNDSMHKVLDHLACNREDPHKQQQPTKHQEASRHPERLRLNIFCRVQKHVQGASLEVVGRLIGSPVEARNDKARRQPNNTR
jgi:hypothetical protein